MLLKALAHVSVCLVIACLLTVAEAAKGGDLPAVPVGTPPAVTEAVFESAIADIRWLGPENKVLLLMTQASHIHRSIDGGKVWADITSQIGGARFQASSINVSPADAAKKNVVAVIGALHEHYVSEDAGKTWREMKMPPGKTRVMWFHDIRPQWVLFSSWTHGCRWVTGPVLNGEGEDGGICSHALYATKDLGRTFTMISTHVLQFDWGDAPHQDRIYFTHFKNKGVAQPRFDHWMEEVTFSFTDDWHQITDVISGGNKFVISHGYIIVATVANKELGLKVSKDAGSHFEKVVMPRHLKEASYIVLDTSEAAVVLHVNHGHGVGHIYVSDISGVHYTLSLENNVRGKVECGFEKVKNLRGIYLANIRDPAKNDFAAAPGEAVKKIAEAITKVKNFSEEETNDHLDSLSTRTQSDHAIRSLKEGRVASSARRLSRYSDYSSEPRRNAQLPEKKIRTVASFDRGGAWTYLRPPEKDSLGDPIDCPPDSCWLHMHDLTEFDVFVPFYSYTNAIGVVMGTGNVGPYLSHDTASTNTYLSRDGGLTWAEAHKGDFIYEFGNHGGLLMMADWVSSTRQAYYSTNQGYSWRSLAFSDRPMNVSNILTELSAMSTKFVIFGNRGFQGVLYHVDFDTSVTGMRVCKGLSAANSAESDYETWTPSDGKSSERCLLGRQQIFSRRKQLAECLNNKDLDWPLQKKNCTCTEEDFECDAGFHRGVNSLACVPEHRSDFYEDENGNAGVCKGDAKFHEIDSYRKVSGDSCTGGWRPEKFRLDCPAINVEAKLVESKRQRPAQGGWKISWLLFVKALVVVLGLVALWCAYTSQRLRNCLMSLRIKMSGQRDYSQTSKAPPSATSDATNIGAPSAFPPSQYKPAEISKTWGP